MREGGENQIPKQKYIENELKEIEITIIAQAIKFSIAVTSEFDNFIEKREEPTYRLLFSEGKRASDSTYLNQMTLFVEGVCFFLHYLSRVAFRPSTEKLREAVYDQIVYRMDRLVVNMLGQSKASGFKIKEGELIRLVNERELSYSKMPSILGRSFDDSQSAYKLAGLIIADELERSKHTFLVQLMRNELLKAISELNLATRLERIEREI